MKMTPARVLFFVSFVLMVGLLLQQCWQSKTASEKWLYFFGESAREYAGLVLGPGHGTEVPIPEDLSGSSIEIFDGFVTFSPKQDPALTLAFSPSGPPVAEVDDAWTTIGDGWYMRTSAPRE